MPRVGYLVLQSIVDPPSRERQAFLDGLSDHGLITGRNIELLYGSAEGEEAFLDDACREMIARKPAVIAAAGAVAVAAVARVTRTIPIVMLSVGDPASIGIGRSLAKPEANVTGVSFISSDLAAKRLELVREILPRAKRVALLWDATDRNAQAEADALQQSLERIGLDVLELPVRSERELPPALAALRERRPDVLYVAFEGHLVARNRSIIAEFGLRNRLAIVSGWSALTEAGALLSYAPDIPELFRRSAYYVSRLLAGSKPSELPIELATRIDLVVNMATAKAFGLTVPPALLLRADRVIE